MRSAPALLAALALCLPLGLAACGESDEDKALGQICAARDDISGEIDTLRGVTLATLTTSAVRDSLQAIREDLETIGDAASELADDRRADVDAANAAVKQAIEQIPDGLGTTKSLEQAKTEATNALTGLAESYRDTFGELDCS